MDPNSDDQMVDLTPSAEPGEAVLTCIIDDIEQRLYTYLNELGRIKQAN
ncbi:MAG: hypothetical protein ACI805_002888 [Candidatus Azotimanducaceae bacterium]|jgi:hypothetical protein